MSVPRRSVRSARAFVSVALATLLVGALSLGGAAGAAVAAPVTLTGRVLLGATPAGAGAVSIRYVQNLGDPEIEGAQTGADGTFTLPTLPSGAYHLHFVYLGAGNFASEYWNNKPSGELVDTVQSSRSLGDIELDPPIPAVGHVTREGGAPLPAGAVKVTATLRTSVNAGPEVASTTTNASGNWTIPNLLPYGLYRFHFDYLPDSGYVDGDTTWMAQGQLASVPYTLLRSNTISGHVDIGTAGSSAGAGDVTVSISSPVGVQSIPTDAAGDFRFTGVVSAAAYQLTFTPASADVVGTTTFPFAVTAADVDRGDLLLQRVGVLRGTVRGPTGAPIAGVWVGAGACGGSAVPDYRVQTATDGNWEIRTTVYGTYALYASAPSAATQDAKRAGCVDTTGGGVFAGLDMQLTASASIAGVVQGFALSAADFASMTVTLDLIDPVTGATSTAGTYLLSSTGYYSATGLAAGQYRVTLVYSTDAGNLTFPSPSPVVLAPGVIAVQNFALPPLNPELWWKDFTGDGLADLIARDTMGRLLVYPGNGHGGFLPRRIVAAGFGAMTALARVGDFDGDGCDDIVARNKAAKLLLYPGNCAGKLGTPYQIGSGWGSIRSIVSAGDQNGDGFPDLFAIDSKYQVWLYPGNGAGQFLPRSLWISGIPTTDVLGVGDFDSDGAEDMVHLSRLGFQFTPGTFLTGSRMHLIPGPWSAYNARIAAGDFNADGNQDIIARDSWGTLWLYAGDGLGMVKPRQRIGAGWTGFVILR